MSYNSRLSKYYLDRDDSSVWLHQKVESIFQKWTECGHIDCPLEIQEMSESNIRERRNYPTSPEQFYSNPFIYS